jgi:cytochrome c556
MKAAIVLAALALSCASGPERMLPAPDHLPSSARALLTEKMINHGDDMSDLLWATLFLDDDSVRDIADHIRSSPKLARPITRDATELNSRLPAEFFALQDELAMRAEELAESAETGDPDAMAAAYGALAQTCVRCHAIYLAEPAVTRR